MLNTGTVPKGSGPHTFYDPLPESPSTMDIYQRLISGDKLLRSAEAELRCMTGAWKDICSFCLLWLDKDVSVLSWPVVYLIPTKA